MNTQTAQFYRSRKHNIAFLPILISVFERQNKKIKTHTLTQSVVFFFLGCRNLFLYCFLFLVFTPCFTLFCKLYFFVISNTRRWFYFQSFFFCHFIVGRSQQQGRFKDDKSAWNEQQMKPRATKCNLHINDDNGNLSIYKMYYIQMYVLRQFSYISAF